MKSKHSAAALKLILPALFALFCLGQFPPTATAQTDKPSHLTSAIAGKGRAVAVSSMPMSFEPNVGQTTRPSRFLARTGGLEIDLGAEEFELWLASKERAQTPVSVTFLGARKDVDVTSSERKQGESNYLLGQNPAGWRTHVPNYGRITYSNLYSGIDAVFYGNGKQLEHDFVVAPDADYRQIRLHISGAKQLLLDEAGNLRLVLANGELSFHRPIAFQTGASGKHETKARFVLLARDEVRFEIGSYDRSRPLFIDPVLSYATYVADQNLYVTAVTADATGNAYVTGQTFSSTYPTTSGAFETTCPSCPNNAPAVFVTKFSADGTGQVFSTLLGGSQYNQAAGIAVDAQGNVVVVGWTQSPDFPVKNAIPHGTLQYPGGPYGFVTSLAPDGASLNYSSILGGFPAQGPNGLSTYTSAVALDSSGNAYITGTTESSYVPVTSGALNLATPAYPNNTVYISKFTPAGSLAYSALVGDVDIAPGYGGSGQIGPFGIKVDAAGNAYIAGDSGSLWPTTTGAYQAQLTNCSGCSNTAPFVAKISADGSALLYSTFIGTSGTVSALAIDGSGDAFITGNNAPTTFPTTANAYLATPPSNGFAPFFSELNPSGSGLLYSSFLYGSGASYSQIYGITLDASGNIWLAGLTDDTQWPLLNPIQSIPATNSSYQYQAGFLSEFDPSGANLLFSTFFNSQTAPSWITGLAFDGAGKLHIAGIAGTDLYTTPGAFLGSVTPPPTGYQYTYGFVAAIDPLTVAPSICIASPQNLGVVFGPVPLGTTSYKTVTVQNCGTQPLTISGALASPSAYSVPAGSDQCLTTVASGGSCTLSVLFSPTAVQSYPGSLTLTSDAAIPKTSLSLSGQGAVPIISVSTNSVTFDPTFVGTASPQQVISIRNNGQAPLTLDLAKTTISPQFTYTEQQCAGEISYLTCALYLTFTPQSAGTITGTLTIVSNDPATPSYTVNLSGVGLASYPAPTINTVSPASVAIGSTGVTLQVNGQNFFPASVIMVNGVAQNTTFVSATYLTAQLDPSLFTGMTELAVTVSNPAPGGGTSAPGYMTVYLSVPIQVAAMVYEPYSRLLYASIPAIAATNPNSVVAIDPMTGNVGTPIAVDTDPGPLAVSDDGQYLYVASNGQNAIQRINLTTLAIEKTFALPVDPTYGKLQARQLGVVPGSPQTVVALLNAPFVSPSEDGMAAFNDAGLINWIPGVGATPWLLLVDSFAFAGNPPVIYASPSYVFSGRFFQAVTVDSSGLHYTPSTAGPAVGSNSLGSDGTLLYTGSGKVWNPSTQSLVATYNAPYLLAQSVVPDDSLGRTFFLDTVSGCALYPGGVCAFDQTTLNETGTLSGFSGVSTSGLQRWGSDGFALFVFNPGSGSGGEVDTFRSSIAHVTTGTNPAPALSSLSTPVVAAGGPNFLLGVTGSNFVRGAVVNLNGNPRTTTFTSGTQLSAYISQADIATAGRALITVTNPRAGGGTSAPLTLFIGNSSQVLLDPIALSFAPLVVGNTSSKQTITVTNTGQNALAISSIAASGDFAQTNTCGTSLAASANCTISVSFTPTVAASRTGTLTLTDNDMGVAGTTQTISLSGTGTASAATVSPASLTFPDQAYNTTSAALPVTLTNPGNTPLTVSGINVAAPFAETDKCVGTIPAKANCTINVTFTPTARGPLTGAIAITSNAANSPITVALGGKGISALMAVSQFNLYFQGLIGVPTAPQTLRVSNQGEVALAFTSISTRAPFSETDNCTGGVAPGASCTLNVTFTPTAAGQSTGTIQFVTNAPGATLSVNLNGYGMTSYTQPFINSLTPPETTAGGPAFTLTVNGLGFGPNSVVYWNGTALATTVVNGGQLTVQIPASSVATAGTPLVTVLNPTPGGSSTGFGFDIINPSPSLTFAKTQFPVGPGPISMVWGDFNGDGKGDLATFNFTDQTVSLLLGNGDGTFQKALSIPTSAVGGYGLAAGDLNHDGKLDLVIADSGCAYFCNGGSIIIMLGNGDGTFQPPLSSSTTDIIQTVAVGDFNGDGKMDVAAGALANSGQVDVFLGNGDGTLSFSGTYSTGVQSPGVAVGDFNGDGKLDIATANSYGTNSASILLGNGDGTFQSPVQYGAGTQPQGIASADLNGDGKLDLVVSNLDASANTVSVFTGNGDGTLATQAAYPTGVGGNSIAVADFNHDGKLDLAVADGDSNTISILLGNGDGTFQANQDYVVSSPGAIVSKDFNGDGAPDIAVASFNDNAVTILLQVSVALVSPASLDFGNVGVGITSGAQAVTVSNTGSGPLSFSAMAASGDFAVASGGTCSTSTPLAGGASCTINVTFTPTVEGSRSGALTIAENGNGTVGATQTVTLSGTGLQALASLSGSSLTFTTQLVNSTSAAQSVTLTNTGNAALSVTSITASGDFAQTNTCGTSVAAGANCSINVTFTPAAGGARTGTLTISDNAAGSPQTASLTGTGEDFSVAPPSGGSTSATVSPGQTTSYTLSIAPTGGLSGTISFTCSGAPSEATCTVTPSSTTTNGTSATNITVNVATTAPGAALPEHRTPLPPMPFGAPMVWLAAALLAFGVVWCRKLSGRPARAHWAVAVLGGLLLAAAFLPSCGGGSNNTGPPPNPGTPAGTYTLTVTATFSSASSTLSHNIALTLKVN